MSDNMLNREKIAQMLEKCGLAGSKVGPIGYGHYNDSFYIDSEDGRYVLRIAPADDVPKLFYEIDMMKSEVGIHRVVREKTNIPAPEIVHYDFSREIIDTDYLVMEYLPGRPGAFDDRELGAYVKELHTISSDACGYPERAAPIDKSWPGIFQKYVGLIFQDCLSCGVIDKKEFREFLSVYERWGHVVGEVKPVLLHLDLWSQNILTVGGKITGILDFDRGMYGDAELEFAVLDTYGYSTDEFFEGYGCARPSDEAAQIRQKLYVVYELIKYAFIRVARGRSMPTGRSFVRNCRSILSELK